MSKNIIYATLDETIYDVSKKLYENRITGLPILDDKGKIVGVISQSDIVKLLEKYKEEDLKNLSLKEFLKKRKKRLIVASPNSTIKRLIRLMVKHDISRVPIVDKDKKLVGIVTKSDIIKLISSELKTSSEKEEDKDKISTLFDRILKILDEKEKISLKDLAKELNESEQILEQNLKILEKYGFVELVYSLGNVIVKKKKWK